MARIFMTGFEDGSLNAFSALFGHSASTTQKRTGSYSMYQNNRDHYVRGVLPSGLSELYIRFGCYVITRVGDGHPLIHLYDSGGTRHIVIGLRSATGAIAAWRDTTILASSATTFTQNTWHCVEVYVKIDDSVGRVTIKVNGVTEVDFTGDTRNSGVAEVTVFDFGRTIAYDTPVQYWDDIAINSVAGAVNNSWIGQGGIVAIIPNGDTDFRELTPSTGTDNFACVDEVPASDVDYVSSAVVDDYDLYVCDTSLLPAVGTINAVKWMARAKVASDAANVTPVIRSEATTEQQPDIALSTSYTVKSLIMEVDPIDDAAWTIDKVAAMEIGAAVG